MKEGKILNFENELTLMKQKVECAYKNIEALIQSARSPVRFNTLIDSAMQQMEIACIEMRNISEQIKPKDEETLTVGQSAKSIYGSATVMENGWLHIKLNTLLPHYKVLGGTQYVSDSITRLLNKAVASGLVLPFFNKAFLGIVEHCSVNMCEAFDSDNKGYKAVINTLKGRLFEDDNQFELSLGLFTVEDNENCCHIYVLPIEDSAKFMWLKSGGGV